MADERHDQVCYVACPTGQLGRSGAWSAPIPVLSGVELISPYVNRADGSYTIFATGSRRFQKLMQGSANTGRIWRAQEIAITAAPELEPLTFKSNTTSIRVTQKDSGLPASRAVANLSANSCTLVYINWLYYVLSPTPIQVPADASGSLTIVEKTDGLHPAVLAASADKDIITFNPMDRAFAKFATLESAEKLRSAQCPSRTVAGGVVASPEFTSLVTPSVNDDTVMLVAQHMTALKEAYTTIGHPVKDISVAQASSRAAMLRASVTKVVSFGFLGDLSDVIDDIGDAVADVVDDIGDITASEVGDVWQWMKNTANTVGRIVKGTVTGILQFFAKVDRISQARQVLDETIATVEGKVNEWANTDSWSPRLGDMVKKACILSGSDQFKNQTPGSASLADKYRDHATQLQILGDSPKAQVVDGLLNDLLTAASNEGHVIGAIFIQLETLLEHVPVVVDALLNVLCEVAQSALNVLDSSVKAIISAGSWDELAGLFGQQQPEVMRSEAVLVSSSSFASSFTSDGPISISKTAQRVTFECCHITAGALSLVGNFMLGLEAEDQTGSEALGISAAIIDFVIAAPNRAGDLLVPMYPVQCLPFKILSRLVISFVVGCKVLFSGPAQWVFQKHRIGTMVVENARGVGAVINGVLVIHDLVVTMWHFYELSENALWDAAIVGEVSSLASYASRLAYGWAVNDKEQMSRLVAITMMGAADDVFGAPGRCW
ncbi:hypothetical protein IFM51744_10110 [Aspergillus udagawae]|nr:hypothetical protein IFM51744_10110 [Aspergillus udagawae]